MVAYELLFRPSSDAEASGTNSEQASARVVTNAVMAFGFETLTKGKAVFINLPRGMLLEGLAGLDNILPPSRVVLELLEDLEADDDVVAACRILKSAGYALALDDFELNARTAGLVPLADYVKIDLLAGDWSGTRSRFAAMCPAGGPALLAEKVETLDQFEAALSEGFDYFQGFFFDRPATCSARGIPGHRLGYLRLLHALQDPALDVPKLERLIEHDASLCYRVLRTVNTARFGQSNAVTSIRQAIVLMGIGTLRRWVSLWLLAGLGEEAHPELLVMSTVRARCCELLAGQVRDAGTVAEGFLLGMCSLLDAILDQPMSTVAEQLPLSSAARAALLGRDNPGRRILECAIAQERGDWSGSEALAGRVGLAQSALAVAHQSALRWSADFLRAV